MMRLHQVEVDDEVFQFVQKHAEPLVDTFNSAIKRLLPLSEGQIQKNQHAEHDTPRSNSTGTLTTIPRNIPQALQHILEVVRLVRGGSYTRTTATQYVARQYKIFPQTVLDKYCRQLNLNAAQFDRLMEEPGLGELKNILKAKFANYAQIIDEVVK